MAYKFQVGPASLSGSLVQTGSLSVLNQLGVTQFSVAKSTGNVSGSGNLQIGGTADFDKALNCDASITGESLTDGTATLTAGALTGVTNITLNGTLSDGNYTFDGSGNVTGLGTVGCGAISSTGASSFGSISSVAAVSSTAHISGATMQAGTLTSTGNVIGVVLTGSIGVRTGGADAWGFSNAGAAKFLDVAGRHLSGSGNLTIVGSSNLKGAAVLESTLAVSGAATVVGLSSLQAVTASSTLGVEGATILKSSVTMPEIPIAALDAADFFVSRDSGTGALQVRTRTNVVSDIAGIGIDAGAGVLSLDLDELPNYASNQMLPSTDIIPILSAASGSVKSTIADLATNMAGAGVTATNGVFSVDTTGGDSMSTVARAGGQTLVPGLNYFAALAADAVVTLPGSPTLGDIVVVKAHTIAAGKSLIINKAGSQTIDGLTSIEIRSDYGAVTLIAAALNDWRIA